MAKRRFKLSVRIPNFDKDWKRWRQGINKAIAKAQRKNPVQYKADDKLDVQIRFYLRDRELTILDVDNRIKHVLDALQGSIGKKGKTGKLKKIIPDDNQIYRIVAEKRLPPKADRDAQSTIVIRRYKNHGGTMRAPRKFRKHLPAQH